jgi:hypothetical protein
MMLVLSATGDPVAFVNLFSVVMIDLSVVISGVRRVEPAWSANNWNCVML